MESQQKLPIRLRHIVHDDGKATIESSVFCPARARSLALSVCSDCARCEQIEVTERGGQVHCLSAVARRAAARGHDFSSEADYVSLSALMKPEVACVTRGLPIAKLTALMLEGRARAMPVVDELGRPIGLISASDLLRAHTADTCVRDLMSPLAYTLQEQDSLASAAAVMALEEIHHLPVVSSDGSVVGMLSSLDLVRFMVSKTIFAELLQPV